MDMQSPGDTGTETPGEGEGRGEQDLASWESLPPFFPSLWTYTRAQALCSLPPLFGGGKLLQHPQVPFHWVPVTHPCLSLRHLPADGVSLKN